METPWEIRHTNVAVFREVEEDGVTAEYLNNYRICEVVGHGNYTLDSVLISNILV